MKIISKHKLEIHDIQFVDVPFDAKILDMQVSPTGDLFLWEVHNVLNGTFTQAKYVINIVGTEKPFLPWKDARDRPLLHYRTVRDVHGDTWHVYVPQDFIS